MSVDETFLGSMPLFEMFVRDLGEVQQQQRLLEHRPWSDGFPIRVVLDDPEFVQRREV